MRHRNKPKLKVGYDKSRRIMRSMVAALVLYEHIDTTLAKAKLVRSAAERLISKGRQADLHKKRLIFSALPPNAARKVFEVLGPKYAGRKGGYTRIMRLGPSKDGTPMARIEFV